MSADALMLMSGRLLIIRPYNANPGFLYFRMATVRNVNNEGSKISNHVHEVFSDI